MTLFKIAAAVMAVTALTTITMTRCSQAAPPFDTPSWVPDEETKKQALKRAYDISQDREFKERILVPPPVDPNVHNELDEKADKPVKNKRQKLIHKTEVVEKAEVDICKIHKMHRVPIHGGKSWRCER